MKKLNLIISLILGTSMASFAQEDATSYITNPSFENNGTKGWTTSNFSVQSNTSFTKKDGTFYIEKWVASGNTVGSASVKQTVKLPVGTYTLTVAAQNYKQSATTTKCTGAYIYAGTENTAVYTPDDYTVAFVNKTGSVEIGFVATSASGNWLAVDNFRLTRTGDVDASELYTELTEIITTAEALQVDGLDSKISADLATAITNAKAVTETASADEIVKAITDINDILPKAQLAYNLLNATPGTGTAPRITLTNHYVPTGATEALMRASNVGANILERGVCWSTEHNPTVLDERTTEYWTLNGNIYHISGLEPATVYYLRPYVMNKTYTVAYGDEVKIVTHPKGSCTGTWNNGAPDEAANIRCSTAIQQTIEYFNEWTGIKGFTLTGSYGASTPTADCSYGGSMRIGPNSGNQAIGTVIHETGHGVGVGTSDRWSDTNVHNWKWYGREANKVYSFLENKEANPYLSDFCMVGDSQHGWGQSATYDWFVNGADKDKHLPLQYAGGCILLYGLFIDGLNPTSSYTNGLPGYTYNFDAEKKYYIMCKDVDRGLGDGLLYLRNTISVGDNNMLTDHAEISDSAAWYIDYIPLYGYYTFRNALQPTKYLTHASGGSSVALKTISGSTKVSTTEYFQLMPDRTDVTIGENSDAITTHGYWFTWNDNGTNKSMAAKNEYSSFSKCWTISQVAFDYSDAATKQQWIIISEDELPQYMATAISTAIQNVSSDKAESESVSSVCGIDGMRYNNTQKGINIVRYGNGKVKKILTK